MNAATQTAIELIGRNDSRADIEGVLTAVRRGLSGVLVVRGEAGIGKTALLDEATRSAGALDVHRIIGIESEMKFGYASLHQLLRRFVDLVDDLPSPQARALRSALGLGEAIRPDRFLVGLATLTVLSAAADRRQDGLLVIVDDAQWVDPESAGVIAFVAHRLHADRIALLIGIRGDAVDTPFDDLPTCTLEPLGAPESRALVDATAHGSIDELTRTRIVNAARGNPLAIVELAAEATREPRAKDEVLSPLPINAELVARYTRRFGSLSPAAQRLLLAMATDTTGDLALLWRVGRQRTFDEGAVREAELAELITVGPPITFRHPLIREAVYYAATEAERRRTHAAFANALADDSDPRRRAWHRAAATAAPDEDVADELEAAADFANEQGGYAASAAYLARAAELTLDPKRRAALLLRAAAADLTAGRPRRAEAHLSLLTPADDPMLDAQVRRLESIVSFYVDRTEASAFSMLAAAEALQRFDVTAARDAYLEALVMAMWVGRAGRTRPRDVAMSARSRRITAGERGATDQLLDGLAAVFTDGFAAAAPLLRTALIAAKRDLSVLAEPRRVAFACWAAFALGDMDALVELASGFVELARAGAINYLAEALHYLGQRELAVGSLATADAYFTNRSELQLARGNDAWDVDRLLVLAWRGDESGTRALAAELVRRAEEHGVGWAATRVDSAVALLELGLGNYAAATGGTSDGWSDDLGLGPFTAADAIEAHVRCGDVEAALPTLEWLTERALATTSALDLGLLARARALVAADGGAETEYGRSVDLLRRAGALRQRARTQLLYGEWLRGQRRRKDARVQLRAAYEIFGAAGAAGFAERARLELANTGEVPRRTSGAEPVSLTPQESQIARLAARGAKNPEIAAELYISPSTVVYHLHKIFRKLGITSRRDLPNALGGDE